MKSTRCRSSCIRAERLPLLEQELALSQETHRAEVTRERAETESLRRKCVGLEGALREVNAELAGARGELGTARGEVASLPRKALREVRAELLVAKETVEAESKRAAELQEEMENSRAARNAEVARLKSELTAKEQEVQRLQALDDRVEASAGAIAEQIDLLLETVEEVHHSSPGGKHQGLQKLHKLALACCKVVEPAEAFCYWKLGRAE